MSKSQHAPDQRQQFPLSSEQLRGRAILRATAEMPEAFRTGSSDEQASRRAIRFVNRTAKEVNSPKEAVLALDGYRPPWVAASFSPRRARMPPPPVVRRRGRELTPLVVWQPDDRRTYNDTNYPWGCVCKTTTAFGRVGSGVLIGPRHVLTASHCVEWSTDLAEKIEVHLTGTAASARAFAVLAYAFTRISGDPGISEVDEDYAVLVTDERLGDQFGWMGTKTYDSAWDGENIWRTIGYPTDVAGGLHPTYQRDKNLDEDEWDLGSARAMTTSADVMKGHSGGPMFAFWDDAPYVVAVVSSEGIIIASGTENWCSGGTDLGRLVRQARDENP